MTDHGMLILGLIGAVLCILYMVVTHRPKYPGPTIEEMRSHLSSIKQRLKGSDALKRGVSVYVMVERSSGDMQLVVREPGVPVEMNPTAHVVEVMLNARSNCRDLARQAVEQLRIKHNQGRR